MNITALLSTTASGLSGWAAVEAFVRLYITSPLIAYVLPVAIPLNAISNVLVLLVLALSERVASSISNTVRVYYMALAIAAEFLALTLHLAYFTGTVFDIFPGQISLKSIGVLSF